ncbi:TPA: ORC1-type DNA replication protein [Candidatus Bathyarchaeota archaeon]|nr:ORC1-type DNA replication protein [Candidatus Bathyarchaeota archaeon]
MSQKNHSSEQEILNNIFEKFLKGYKIFKNREVLRHDYVPEYLPHREEQIRHLGEIVAPTLVGHPCSNVFIYGKTGTGKTAVIRYVLKRLIIKAKSLTSPVKTCYVNCRMAGTEYRILSSLCNSIFVNVPFTGLAIGEVLDRFRKGLDSSKILLIIVLDEIDVLVKERGDSLLYELTRLNESLMKSRISLIGISNDLRFKEFLDPRVLSALSEEELVFRPYNADELKDILRERAKMAFHKGVLTDGALSLCAALAAAEHGDARRALDLLRVAGEIAEREGAKKIIEEHVEKAEKRIEHDRISEALKNLPTHSKLVLLSVYILNKIGSKQLITGDIYQVYCEICEKYGLSPLTQRRVSGLINELDIIGLLNSRVVSLGRYGRTKKINLSIPKTIIKEVFMKDERFSFLMKYNPKILSNSPKYSTKW